MQNHRVVSIHMAGIAIEAKIPRQEQKVKEFIRGNRT